MAPRPGVRVGTYAGGVGVGGLLTERGPVERLCWGGRARPVVSGRVGEGGQRAAGPGHWTREDEIR